MSKQPYQRELRWNVISEDSADIPVQHWFFVIVNEQREAGIIKQRIREMLAPTSLERTVTEGLIPDSEGLHYIAITIDSYQAGKPEDINMHRIYKKRKRRDEKLGSHRSSDGLRTYIENMFA